MTVYTLGIWVTKAGREDEFAACWRDFARWTLDEVDATASGTLLRDRDNPSRFVSFGPWSDPAMIEAWRAHPGFAERVARMRELLVDFSPMTLDEVTLA